MTEIKVPDAGGATINMIDLGGFRQPIFFKPASEVQEIFEKVPKFKFRDDDLMLCTFGKTGTYITWTCFLSPQRFQGTNWVFEILMMILNRSAKRIDSNKVLTMLECVTAEEADKQPSPRVVNSHFPPRFLPLVDMKAKCIKTVLCIRNPKDTAVSYYNHLKGMKTADYDGRWEDWLPVCLEGKLEYGKYSEYLLEWQKLAQNDPGFPLHIMYFEDLKMNGREELNRLLEFLEVVLDEQLKSDIMDMCGFKKMQADKGKNKTTDAFFKPDFKFFRKGEVGDWKNWFTVAQNELFDSIWEKETKNLEMFKFKYTQSDA